MAPENERSKLIAPTKEISAGIRKHASTIQNFLIPSAEKNLVGALTNAIKPTNAISHINCLVADESDNVKNKNIQITDGETSLRRCIDNCLLQNAPYGDERRLI